MKRKLNVLMIGKADPRFGDFKRRLNHYNKIANHFYVRPTDILRIKRILDTKKIDMITTQDPRVCGWVGLMISKLYGLPINMQVHGFEFLENPVDMLILKQADTVRVVSEILRRKAIQEGIKADKIHVIPVITFLDGFKPMSRSKARRLINLDRPSIWEEPPEKETLYDKAVIGVFMWLVICIVAVKDIFDWVRCKHG